MALPLQLLLASSEGHMGGAGLWQSALYGVTAPIAQPLVVNLQASTYCCSVAPFLVAGRLHD